MSKKVKALKVTVSGSYRTANKEIVDFENVSGVIPFVEEEIAIMHTQGRYTVTWIKNAMNENGEKVYPKRTDGYPRQIFVDSIEEVSVDPFSFIGKDIKEMDYAELQDLATMKDLRKIPLPKEISDMSIREMREVAYLEYAVNVDGQYFGDKNQDFNYSRAPALIVKDGARKDESIKLTNDEIIEQEQSSQSIDGAKNDLTINDLKAIAKNKNISYHPNIGFDALHAKLYGGSAA